MFVCVQIQFALEKNKFWGKFSKLLVSYMEIINFCVVYGNCMVSIFFQKKLKISFFLSPVCSQKAAERV